MTKKNFLIIGGYGYVGTHLRKYLTQKYDLSEEFGSARKNNGKIYDIDILSSDYQSQLKESLLHEYDAVFYLAANSMVSDGILSPFSTLENNVGQLMYYLKMLKGKAKTWVFASSSSVYASDSKLVKDGDGYSENSPTKIYAMSAAANANDSIYAVSKILGERILQAANHEYGLKSISLRFGNIAGNEIQSYVWKNHLIPKLLLSEDRKITFYGNPNSFSRDYVHINDVCIALDLAWQYSLTTGLGYEVFNIASGQDTTNAAILKKVETYLDKKFDTVIGDERIGEEYNIKLDITKAKQYLGWEPKKNLNDIIQSYVGVV